MALYPGLTLTDAGIQMIAESQLNETKLIITKAKIGDGDLPMGQDISKMTDVLSPKLEAPFSSFKNLGDGQIDIKFAVSNAEVKAGFFAKEIGIFATLEDGSETLYAYTNAGDKTDWVPDKSNPIDSQIIECQLKIGNAPNVIINISDKTYALAEDLANHESSDESHKDLFDSIKIALNTKADKLVNGHGIVRSVNNQYADGNGNVNVDLSNKADKLVNGHGIVRSVNNQYADDNGNVNVDLSGIANELNEFKSSVKDYVVESYSDGKGNWYRKFKSGWVEQGGVLPVLSKVDDKVVSLLKPFATNKYTVLTQNYHNGDTININSHFGSGLSVGRFSVFKFTTTSFKVYYGYSSKDGLEQKIWYACGQGA